MKRVPDEPLHGAFARFRRSATVIRRLAPFIIAFLRDRRRWLLFGAPRRASEAAHRERAANMVDAIASLGPTFIKLAQVFSARADILPEPYLSEIGRLQDAVPPVHALAVERIIAAELGRPPDQIFESFDRTPLAAASLGQVHRARFNGEDVAVKVLRPGVENLIALDLDISFRILFVLNVLFPNHHVRALTVVFREFERRITDEVDMRLEAENTEHFRRMFEDDPRVRAPRVIEPLTRRRVLVTEFVRGEKVDRLHKVFETGAISFQTLMETLTEVYLRMMMIDGFLHADPHPGNILVQSDGTIVFLDFGMVVQVDRDTRNRIFQIATAAAREDVDGIINGMYELGMIDPDISRAEIREAAVRIIAIIEQARTLSHRKMQEMVQAILDTFYTWPLILPQELVYFFRATALLEGIGIRYDPHFTGIDSVKPVISRLQGELLESAGRTPGQTARGIVDQTEHAVRALYDLVGRAEREELRFRAHPRDVLQLERFLELMVRRMLLGIAAAVMAVVSTLVFVATGLWWVLLVGNGFAIFLFLLIVLVPAYLLENPWRRVRDVRRG